MLTLLVVACTGVPANTPPSSPITPIMDASSAPVPTPPPKVTVGTDPTGAVKLDPALIDQIVQVRAEYDTISDAQGFANAWRDAKVLSQRLAETLQPAFEKSGYNLDLKWLTPALPAMHDGAVAEGTMLAFDLDYEPWSAKAKSTTDPVDDRFLELVNGVYGSAKDEGWSAWQERNWDYGGCSTFGTGMIVDLLKKADEARAAGNLFAGEIGAMRTRMLDAVIDGEEQFPYCDGATMQPRDTAKLQEEARRILSEVKLAPDEKAKIEARIPKLKGQPFKGG